MTDAYVKLELKGTSQSGTGVSGDAVNPQEADGNTLRREEH